MDYLNYKLGRVLLRSSFRGVGFRVGFRIYIGFRLTGSQCAFSSLSLDWLGSTMPPTMTRLTVRLRVGFGVYIGFRLTSSHCAFSSLSLDWLGSTMPPTMTRFTSFRSFWFCANQAARPVRFFTLSSRAIEKRIGLLRSCNTVHC